MGRKKRLHAPLAPRSEVCSLTLAALVEARKRPSSRRVFLPFERANLHSTSSAFSVSPFSRRYLGLSGMTKLSTPVRRIGKAHIAANMGQRSPIRGKISNAVPAVHIDPTIQNEATRVRRAPLCFVGTNSAASVKTVGIVAPTPMPVRNRKVAKPSSWPRSSDTGTAAVAAPNTAPQKAAMLRNFFLPNASALNAITPPKSMPAKTPPDITPLMCVVASILSSIVEMARSSTASAAVPSPHTNTMNSCNPDRPIRSISSSIVVFDPLFASFFPSSSTSKGAISSSYPLSRSTSPTSSMLVFGQVK
mmetsp:Transcript_34870/g.90341  ORF Transcript_34870/g.90341 Transcript_34870/m.90341 type:complete len:305 (+) Transcript_34870:1170-2084(+)